MGAVLMASMLFAAGFLNSALIVAVLTLWAFSDRRVLDKELVITDRRREGRGFGLLTSGG